MLQKFLSSLQEYLHFECNIVAILELHLHFSLCYLINIHRPFCQECRKLFNIFQLNFLYIHVTYKVFC